ncbi:MAG: hypothetical protein U0793_19055 [Gemmataceae bacterium]
MRTFFFSLSALALLALAQKANAAVPISAVAKTAGEANGFIRRGGGHFRAPARHFRYHRYGHRYGHRWGHRWGRWGHRYCGGRYWGSGCYHGSYYRPGCHTYCRPYCYRTSCYRSCYRPVCYSSVCYRPCVRRTVCDRVFYRPYCVRTCCPRPVGVHASVTVRAAVRP